MHCLFNRHVLPQPCALAGMCSQRYVLSQACAHAGMCSCRHVLSKVVIPIMHCSGMENALLSQNCHRILQISGTFPVWCESASKLLAIFFATLWTESKEFQRSGRLEIHFGHNNSQGGSHAPSNRGHTQEACAVDNAVDVHLVPK